MNNEKTKAHVQLMKFALVYELYVKKVERKNRSVSELNEVVVWLTGYEKDDLERLTKSEITMGEFFDNAPRMNEHASKITGVICGVRVEEIEDSFMQKVRWMDKVVDELAKGKYLEKILRK